MSDTPGGNTHSRDRRRKERSRKKRDRHPVRQDGGPAEPHPPRDNRRPLRQRNRNRPRREKKTETAPAAKTMTLGQKLLLILTFGLVRPKSAAKAAAPRRESNNHLAKKAGVQVPPADPDAVTFPRLHVGNLHYDINEDDLLNLFKGIGPVKSVDIIYNGHTHRSRGWGFVEFMSLEDARRAVAELHGLPYLRRPLILGPALARGKDEREADTPEE